MSSHLRKMKTIFSAPAETTGVYVEDVLTDPGSAFKAHAATIGVLLRGIMASTAPTDIT